MLFMSEPKNFKNKEKTIISNVTTIRKFNIMLTDYINQKIYAQCFLVGVSSKNRTHLYGLF